MSSYFDAVDDLKKRGIFVKSLKKEYKMLCEDYNKMKNANVSDSTLISAKRKIRKIEKDIRDISRKNMHQHIALSLFRGTPYCNIVSKYSKTKIRPESVFEFITEITSLN
jgi:cytoplasmic iron level regulating protein YaaA (DUF328/UPF0246 family)